MQDIMKTIVSKALVCIFCLTAEFRKHSRILFRVFLFARKTVVIATWNTPNTEFWHQEEAHKDR